MNLLQKSTPHAFGKNRYHMNSLLSFVRSITVVFIAAIFSFQSGLWAQSAGDGNPPPQAHKLTWPRTLQDGSSTLVIYQPEIEKWDGNAFQARSAVSVQASGQQAPTFGVIWLTARVDVDKGAGIVTLTDVQITKANFPTEPDKADLYLAALRKQIPSRPIYIPLAQIDNNYLLSDALKKADAQPVKNDPPKIIFSKQSALLILVDGDPVMRPIPDANCQRVFNTRALILQGAQGGSFYLRAVKYWFKAESLQGPWTVEPKPPANIAEAGKSLIASKQVDPIDPPGGKDRPATPPSVYVSTVPAELVQTQGDPQFVPIPDTQLLEVKNSNNAIILDVNSQNYYVLISGRWFSAKSMSGPWAFVDGKDLPADFAKIPPDSDKANVLVSVPNTPQAKEAVIANSIPQTATIKRSEAKLTVKYDGAPQFKPIEGTPLQYAVNTPLPVIAVAPNSFYCVAHGVWFTASTPMGPWAVAIAVPPVIYTIPVSSPLHYVTYVRVYGYTDEVVYVGYTPGYYGTIVTPDGTVVYGTGYAYPVYVGTTTYVAPPPTYGYGAGFADGAVSGFAFGFVAGACLEPYWGCWYGGSGNTVNVNVNNGNIYNNWGTNTVSQTTSWSNGSRSGTSTTNGAYNPYTGNWGGTRQSSTYNSNTGRETNRSGSASGNTYNGDWSANSNRESSNANGGHSQSHTTASGNSNTGQFDSTTTRSGETGNGAKAGGISTDNNGNVNHTGAAYNPNTGNGAVWHDGNVYTDNNGNVYKHSEDGGWQSNTKDGWQNTTRNSANESQFQNLDRQSQGWRQGNQRFQQQQRGAGGGLGGEERERGGGGGFRRGR